MLSSMRQLLKRGRMTSLAVDQRCLTRLKQTRLGLKLRARDNAFITFRDGIERFSRIYRERAVFMHDKHVEAARRVPDGVTADAQCVFIHEAGAYQSWDLRPAGVGSAYALARFERQDDQTSVVFINDPVRLHGHVL